MVVTGEKTLAWEPPILPQFPRLYNGRRQEGVSKGLPATTGCDSMGL